jgi:hypothetical protein
MVANIMRIPRLELRECDRYFLLLIKQFLFLVALDSLRHLRGIISSEINNIYFVLSTISWVIVSLINVARNCIPRENGEF